MKKINKIIILIIFVLIIISGLFAFLYQRYIKTGEELTAHITLDGKEIKTIPLDQVKETYTLRIDTANNGYNIIEISTGHIKIIESNCPDQICIEHGDITPDTLPAICLPHGLIIEVTGKKQADIDTFTY